ncbi:MAG: YmfQ family protein [Treponema sp.]|jgi:hypothetical protein|nr:YmfQ family protein [Treponema sp.]
MGLAVASGTRYENAVKKLFPLGEYWDEQFADPASDVSLFVKVEMETLIHFRTRMSNLLEESRPETTDELIADWERVLLETINSGKTLAERRLLLKSRENDFLNRPELRKIAAIFGLYIKDVYFPCRPRFFGFARFAHERLGGFTTFSVLKIIATEDALELKHWEIIKAELERHRFVRVHFGLERLAYFPVYKRREIVWRKLRRGCFGYGRFAQNTIAPFPVDEARQTALTRPDEKRTTKLFFGQSRAVFFAGRFAPSLMLDQDYFGEYIADILQTANFKKRFERALLDEYFTSVSPYYEFEQAIRNKLLANQIPIFYYEGA